MASQRLVVLPGDLAGRLAVVPMSQEAKGLDAGPRLAEKLVGCGDNRSAAIVSRIAAEEKAHVAVGGLQLMYAGSSCQLLCHLRSLADLPRPCSSGSVNALSPLQLALCCISIMFMHKPIVAPCLCLASAPACCIEYLVARCVALLNV